MNEVTRSTVLWRSLSIFEEFQQAKRSPTFATIANYRKWKAGTVPCSSAATREPT